VVIGHDRLDVLPRSSARPETVSDGSRKESEVGEVRVDVNGVEVSRDLGVRLVGSVSGEGDGRSSRDEGVGRVERDSESEGRSVPLEVLENGVSLSGSERKIDGSDLDEVLDLVSNVGGSLDDDGGVGGLVLVSKLGLGLEDEGRSGGERRRVVVPREPILRLKNSDLSLSEDGNRVVDLLGGLEGVLVVGESSSVEEGRGDLDGGLAVSEDGSNDLDGLSRVGVDDRDDSSLRGADVSSSKRSGSGRHLESVREVDELEEITVDGRREDRLHDGLGGGEKRVRKRTKESVSKFQKRAGKREDISSEKRKEGKLTCHPVTIAKSIGACTSFPLPVLNASPWFSTISQNLSISSALMTVSGPLKTS